METFSLTVPQRNEITIEIDDLGYVEISQSDGTMNPDNHSVIRIHRSDLESLIAALQEAERSQ